MSNKMKVFDIKDIHSGYVVKFRNNTYALVTRVGDKFTKIFALVEEKARVKDVREGRDFFYTSAYRDNYHYAYRPLTTLKHPDPDHDVVAVYGLIHGVNNYLYAGTSLVMNRPLLWEEEVKEMTLEEIEKKLGHKVKVVSSDPTTKYYQIKSDDLCDSCKYSSGNSGCLGVVCDDCKVRQSAPRCGSSCPCNMVPDGAPCPYYEEDK